MSCKRFQVEHKTLLGCSIVTGEKADKILTSARRKLLSVGIGQTHKTVKSIQAEIDAARRNLRFLVNEETYSATLHLLLQRKNTIKGRPGSTTATRASEEDIEAKRKWVVNVSSWTLTPAEQAVLVRGLGYAPTPTSPPSEDFIVASESAAHMVGPETEDAAVIRSTVTSLLSKPKSHQTNNFTLEERQALNDLKQDKTIMVLPPDKGRATCIMDRTEYGAKMRQLLSDEFIYWKLPSDPTSAHKTTILAALAPIKQYVP